MQFPQQQVVTTCVRCCLPGKPFRDSVSKVFIGGWSHGHPLPSMYLYSRLPEGKQVFRIYCLHRQFKPSELPVLGMVFQKSKFPNASQGPTLQAGLSKDGSFRTTMIIFSTPLETISFLRTDFCFVS